MYFKTLEDATVFCQLPCIYSLKDSTLGRLHFQKILMCIKMIIYYKLSFFYSVKLTIMWIVGCFIRYVILFPMR